MKFKIEHTTDDEQEYNAIMDVLRHYELSKPSLKKVCPCCYGEGQISDLDNGGTKRCPMCEGKPIPKS